MGAANWYIDAVYMIGGEEVSVNTVYNDRSSFFADRACNNMAIYFQKAVSAHLRQLYASPVFKAAIGERGMGAQVGDEKTRMSSLQELLSEGLITEDEYNQKRKAIIDGL
jgi:hypothetical protein